MNTMYKTRGASRSAIKRGRKEGHRCDADKKKRKKMTKYVIIHKLRWSVFGQSLAVSHRLTTNNNNLIVRLMYHVVQACV